MTNVNIFILKFSLVYFYISLRKIFIKLKFDFNKIKIKKFNNMVMYLKVRLPIKCSIRVQ